MSKQLKLLLQELDEKPYRKFNVAFSLMSLLPLLVTFYIIITKLSTIQLLEGNIGIILFISIFISVCGYFVGYKIVSNILQKVTFYAAKAKHSDQLKSKLVASVSHEFKNPLGALKLCLFDMTDNLTAQMDSGQKEMLSRCNNIIDRMNRLVNDLLDVYKIEAAMVEMDKRSCNIIELLEVQIKEFGTILNKNNINLKLIKEGKDSNLAVWVDKEKVTLAINNLLSNAIKYSHEGGEISVKVYCVDEFIRMEFVDAGPGIPDDKLDKVFDKFEKLDLTKEGTGLGLAITKDIVESHKGKIWVVSELGKGSKFIVILPRNLRKITK